MYKIIFARKIFPYLPEKSFNKWRFLYICKNSSPMSDYKPRIADALLKRKLAGKGAVLIHFPYLPWRLAQCRWNGPWYCSRPCIWLLRRDGRYGLIEIKLGGEALVPYGTCRCRQHCIQTPRGWHLCRSDRLFETLICSASMRISVAWPLAIVKEMRGRYFGFKSKEIGHLVFKRISKEEFNRIKVSTFLNCPAG